MTGEGTPESPNFYTGLTESEKEEVQMHLLMAGNPEIGTPRAWFAEHTRLGFLAVHALRELKERDPGLYYQVTMVIKADHQQFYDLVNHVFAGDLELGHMDANVSFADPQSFEFSGLMTNDGFPMRAVLIERLTDKPQAGKLVEVLKQLQAILPEFTEEDEE